MNVRCTRWRIVGIPNGRLSLNRGGQQAMPPAVHKARAWSIAAGWRSPIPPMGAWATIGDTASPSTIQPQRWSPAIQPAAQRCSAVLGNMMTCVSSRSLLHPLGRWADRCGQVPMPGEVSLAHHVALLLDELPEFRRHILGLRTPSVYLASRFSCALFYSAVPSSDNACMLCPCAHSVYSISFSAACALLQPEGRSTRSPVSSSQVSSRWNPRTWCLARGDRKTARRAVQARTNGRQCQLTMTSGGPWPCQS
jgi:hypothetical protein